MKLASYFAFAFIAAGCGSAIQSQSRAATIAAIATQGAARMVSDAAREEAEGACPRASLLPGSAELSTCLAPIRQRWAPADAAIGVTRATLSSWVIALDVARSADAGEDLLQALAVAAARLVSDYEAMRLVLTPLGVEIPPLPPLVLRAASMLGGDQ